MRMRINHWWLVLAAQLLFALDSFAQNPSDKDVAKGLAACGACGGTILIPIIGIIVLNIAILVWVARDAKNRSMDSPILWMAVVFFTGPIGLIIYVFSRPKGNLIPCPKCQNKRLQASAKCPHCGNP